MLELKQNLKLAQKLVMTPQLRQAIKLLQLNRLELTDALQAELEQNPMLEEAPEVNDQNKSDILAATETATTPELPVTSRVAGDDPAKLAEVNWQDYLNNFDSDFSFARETPPADAPSQFDFISAQPGLDAYLFWQIAHLPLKEDERDLVQFIVGNLNSHGFLECSVDDICNHGQCSPEKAAAALGLVQNLDPPGIGARDIRESLLLQLERRDLQDTLAYRIVADHMQFLQTSNHILIARKLGLPVRQVTEAINTITSLTPFPGNAFSNEQTKYVVPDVYVFKVDDEFVIQLNEDGLPRLQLSREYKELLKGKMLNAGSRGYLQEKKRNAEWFIKSVEQRQRTIYKVMESILKFQYGFFEKGPAFLKPLILRDVADDIGMHESTVSRVTSNKYVHTPQGIYELKYFFSTAVATTDGNVVAAEVIKNRIRQLIAAEDPSKPLSDNKLSQLLAEEKIKVARRTVAKYRDQLNILPVKHRRKARTT